MRPVAPRVAAPRLIPCSRSLLAGLCVRVDSSLAISLADPTIVRVDAPPLEGSLDACAAV